MSLINPSILRRTRAEEHPDDVWRAFFIPPFYTRLDLKHRTKPVLIQGGRGCGKTMLLKHLHYKTSFSPRRGRISRDELNHIGIYWRVDTQFCSVLNHRGLSEAEWGNAFEHYLTLLIARELLLAIDAVSESQIENTPIFRSADLLLTSPSEFIQGWPSKFSELRDHLQRALREFETWARNVRSVPQPMFIPGRSFLLAIIEELRVRIPPLSDTTFHVYLDEFENLVDYQVRIVNTYVKHSEPPLIVNLAMKRGAIENTATSGKESIDGGHDYDTVDIEREFLDGERDVFFAEVFLANLRIAKGETGSTFVLRLFNPEALEHRSTPEYRQSVLAEARRVLPELAHKEVAKIALENPSLLALVKEKIELALSNRGSPITWSDIELTGAPAEALAILPALLNRRSLRPHDILHELASYEGDSGGRFVDWVHNNLFGSLLELYRPYARRCPLFSGFSAFCTIASGNLRHFLTLCYKTVECSEQVEDQASDTFSPAVQAMAALETSTTFLSEIRTFGILGERLYGFTLRLGNLFRALQSTPTMSEPEQNQISISTGNAPLNDVDTQFLREAIKHSVLLERKETKTKDRGTDVVDYQINPIYSPYFNISYRRKRKASISTDDFSTLSRGSADEYNELVRKLTRTTESPISPQAQLFS